ncbi:hypothetical protein GOP47_0003038 [Adiantum capillus-veneris]|uniref:Molybdenum cofactor sulfurase n=1 Tax=Adiantum capillus-veneris TaxID=13818 RepID=A0A9D4VB80_ADICA|nr:hypothetical protein GOP47_0003038 [Adiantum capillus-veneris]
MAADEERETEFPSDHVNDAAQHEDPRKQEFLSLYKEQYGYPNGESTIDELRSYEFPQLKGDVYLDHAGATLYSRSQVLANLEDLCQTLYGNPHSQSGCSNISSNMVSKAREEVLKFFNVTTAEYNCVFTAGATAALKLVGENFPWTSKSRFWYTMENHNSVLGIREYALAAGASAYALEVEGSGQQQNLKLRACQRRTMGSLDKEEEGVAFSLLAFPSECNFSGKKFDLDLVKLMQSGQCPRDSGDKWIVLIDAAKGCGSSQLDLSTYPADFVAISFYKIFGYPTGLGALLIRTQSSGILQKKYFGGGTVAACVADADFVQRRESIEQWLEDGTVPFLGIAALHKGFLTVNRLGMPNIGMHVGSLAKFTASQLSGLKHENGNRVCVLYGNHTSVYWGNNCNQGPIVTFNLKRSDDSWIGYREVEKLAALNGIHLRTGCFCNPGACSKLLGLSEAEIRANLTAGHICWDEHDIIDGKPTGAVRVSFGYMSSIEDVLALLDFICKFFLNNRECQTGNQAVTRNPVKRTSNDNQKSDENIYLESITIYPIKSCGGFTVDSWPLSSCGLLYDREWVVVSAFGDALTQKKCPMMCLIGTYIEQSRKMLCVTSPSMKRRLEIPVFPTAEQAVDVRLNLCGERAFGISYKKEVADWFTEALGTPCSLVRRRPRSRQVHTRGGDSETHVCDHARDLSYANEGQFLLVSRASVEDLNQRAALSLQPNKHNHKRIAHHPVIPVDPMRFRPNFVVSGGSAFEEDSWQSLNIGGNKFVVLGGCNRCQMINIDQSTGRSQEGSNPLLTLASYRRSKGKILFGLLLANSEKDQERARTHTTADRIIKVGTKVDGKSV